MLTLNTLLDLITARTSIHICIHDISGITRRTRLRIDRKYHTHTKNICETAKGTPSGYVSCIACKDASNKRAADGEEFTRVCPFGILEVIRPVIIEGKTRCIIYLGNLTDNLYVSRKRAEETCNSLGISSDKICEELINTEQTDKNGTDLRYYETLADHIRDYIKLLYGTDADSDTDIPENRHWCVEKAEEYIRNNFENNMTLSSVAGLYFINEKYLGRIFKKETGKTFHQYLTDIRLERSLRLLSENHPIISVSHMCGFVNVTYFNRCFKEKYGISPGEYRRQNKK